jgi:hypothetical protein
VKSNPIGRRLPKIRRDVKLAFSDKTKYRHISKKEINTNEIILPIRIALGKAKYFHNPLMANGHVLAQGRFFVVFSKK